MNQSSISHTLSNLSTSNIKPASHRTPDNPEIPPKPLQHFAFLKQQRSVTQPGNVVYQALKLSCSDLQHATRAHSVGAGSQQQRDVSPTVAAAGKTSRYDSPSRSSRCYESLNNTTSTGTQTMSDMTRQRLSDDASKASAPHEELQSRSQRDIFFDVKSSQVATYR